jgi:hypothetical protein
MSFGRLAWHSLALLARCQRCHELSRRLVPLCELIGLEFVRLVQSQGTPETELIHETRVDCHGNGIGQA